MLQPNVWSDGVSAKGAYMTAGWQARFEHSKSAASILSKRQETTAFFIMSLAVFDNSKSDLVRAIGTATCLPQCNLQDETDSAETVMHWTAFNHRLTETIARCCLYCIHTMRSLTSSVGPVQVPY